MSDPIDEFTTLSQAAAASSVQERAVTVLRRLVRADAVFLIQTGTEVKLLASASPSAEISANLVQTVSPLLAGSSHSRTLSKKFTFREQSVEMLAVLCPGGNVWLVVWLRAEGAALETASQIVRLAASGIPLNNKVAEPVGRAAIALIGAFSRPEKNRLETFAGEASLLLGSGASFLSRRTMRGWKLAASSPHQLPASRSALHEALLQASSNVTNGSFSNFFPDGNSHPALAEICRLTESKSCAVVPMGEGWVLISAWKCDVPPSLREFEEALAPLAPILPALYKPPHSMLLRGRSLLQPRRNRVWAFLSLLVTGAMFIPIPLRIHSPAILEPSLRRFISAPFDCVLEKVHVESGTLVKKDVLLAELDGKELRERIAEIEAQAASANLQNASDLAGSRFDESALSSLQAQRAGHELEVLRHREKALKILSPIAGVVIQGDLKREEGSALKLGHPIMEVAPLDKMVAEVAVKEEDVFYLHPGQKLTIRLHALPSVDIHTTIKKVNLRAETRDGRNIFVAEAEIKNQDGLLRPGMKGDAVIKAEKLPLFWVLFRKPWTTVRKWLFW